MVLWYSKMTPFLLIKWIIITRPENDRGLAFNDALLAIDWIVDKEQLQLSQKDTRQPTLYQAELFDYGIDLYA